MGGCEGSDAKMGGTTLRPKAARFRVSPPSVCFWHLPLWVYKNKYANKQNEVLFSTFYGLLYPKRTLGSSIAIWRFASSLQRETSMFEGLEIFVNDEKSELNVVTHSFQKNLPSRLPLMMGFTSVPFFIRRTKSATRHNEPWLIALPPTCSIPGHWRLFPFNLAKDTKLKWF